MSEPAAVRYAWADNPVCNLYSNEGLPLTPFRTDDWPGVTINNSTSRACRRESRLLGMDQPDPSSCGSPKRTRSILGNHARLRIIGVLNVRLRIGGSDR